ncbi:MAG: CTP synthase [Alphaproteobacteria bacterium]|nr:CTP synthase [Alphaproteobacteria bacterium]
MSHFIFVTGGVMSSLGKGIAASCIGALLQLRGYSVKMKKLDPYINVDPGTMSPYKHGEVFVMDDGCEADLDFGHYERFTGITCSGADSLTTGRIYEQVLAKERRGDYLGSDIQVIPHITTEIKAFILRNTDGVDFTICEIGGTVGDIEGLPYIETLRQLSIEMGKQRTMRIHLTFLPYIKVAEELKTKPTQHSVRQLQSMGVQPDILLCRSECSLPEDVKSKLSMFCNVEKSNVIAALDADNIHLIPTQYHAEGLDRQICRHFGINTNASDEKIEFAMNERWGTLRRAILHPHKITKIAVIGKYTKLKDAYISLTQALSHAGFENDAKIEITWINAEDDPDDMERALSQVAGILVPGGFSSRGTEGKIFAIKYARENRVPFLGICLGLQLAVIEGCRNVAGLTDATSREFLEDGETGSCVIDLMKSWTGADKVEHRDEHSDKGGTMRLGSYPCKIALGTLAFDVYKREEIAERHRHRYEVNVEEYADAIERAGIFISGTSLDGKLPEIIERKGHPFFIATQPHPEFKSRPFSPHPLFCRFIRAALVASKQGW